MARSTQVTDYAEFLQTLDNKGKSYFLEGGQAVNFWAEYYSHKSNLDSKLGHLRPFTSKDCDIWVSHAALKYLESDTERGSLKKEASPVDGQIAIYTIKGNPPLEVNLMGGVYGIPEKMNEKLSQRALNFNGLRVLDPPHLLRSKCHCLVELDQTDRQDQKHLSMLVPILAEYVTELIEQASNGKLSERAVLAELKILLKINKDRRIKDGLAKIGSNAIDLFPVKALKSDNLPLVSQFTQMTLVKELS
ncbi:MAG: hypothetical protein KJO79_03280 [Verrucomicrobiae bacterium]|nr:hypothetical protein [Verrucomicrobiae bacterium]NNJ86178.1 hypothetical protein [Akkermansiaceae bacterium]